MLHDGCHAFQTHARIHAGFGQGVHIALFIAVVLHKYAVPNLNKTVAVFFGTAWNAAPNVFAVVVKDFRARTARTRIAHLPEVIGGITCAFVVADADDFVFRQPDLVAPNGVGFFVFGIDGGKQFFFGQVQPLRGSEKFPCKFDGVLFEVVAKGKIAHHFKKGVVAGGVADVFQIVVLAACADAFLCGGGAAVGALVKTEKNVFKLVHACVGKQQGGVVVGNE